jgi:hypothetical protein
LGWHGEQESRLRSTPALLECWCESSARLAPCPKAEYEPGSLYPNFTERAAGSSRFYSRSAGGRLQRIRAGVDLHPLTVGDHPIVPNEEEQ